MVEIVMTDDFSRLVTSYFKNDYRERGKVNGMVIFYRTIHHH